MKWTDGLRIGPGVVGSRLLGGPPYKLLLSLTDRCNHRCRHCHAWQRPVGPELTPAEIGRVLQSLPTLRWLELTGGEPTLRPDLDDVVAAMAPVVPRLVFLHFATNGSRPERAVALARGLQQAGGPRPVVTVSIDGDQALHDALRGREGAFESALETARRLTAWGGADVYIGTTLTPDNLAHLEALRTRLVRELPWAVPTRWHVNLMNRSPHFFGNLDQAAPDPAAPGACSALSREGAGAACGENGPSAQPVETTTDRLLGCLPGGGPPDPQTEPDSAMRYGLLEPVLDRIAHLRGRPRDAFGLVEWVFWRTLRRYLRTGRAPAPCQAVRASLFVSPTGQVFGCHILDHALGNVREFDLDLVRLVHGPAARAERARLARDGCHGCWTACEAWHAIAASPLRSLGRSLR